MDQLTLQSLFKVNEVEIIYRNTTPYQDRIQIRSSATAYEILLAGNLGPKPAAYWSNSSKSCCSISKTTVWPCVGYSSTGGTIRLFSRSQSHLRDNGSERRGPAVIILAHNHPKWEFTTE